MVVTVALCLLAASLAFGAVSPDLAAPLYGFAILLAAMWVFKLLFAKAVSWRFDWTHLGVLGFVGYAVFWYYRSPIEYNSRLELIQILLYAFGYFVVVFNIHHARERRFLFIFLTVLASLQATYGIWQFLTSSQSVLHLPRPEAYEHRASGTYICPNHLAGFLELVLGLLLANIAVRRSSRGSFETSALNKVFLGYAALVIMAGIILTLSRAGWVATAIGALVVLLWGDWRSRSMWPRLAVAAVSVVVLVVMLLKVPTTRDYLALTLRTEQTTQAAPLRDSSMGGRVHMWGSTVSLIGDHPVLGTGPATWEWLHLKYRHPKMQTHPTYAHNDILNLISDYGLVGFALVVATLVCFFRHAIRLARSDAKSEKRAYAVGSMISVSILLIHSWFDFNLHIPVNALTFVIIMALTIAIEEPDRGFRRVEMPRVARYLLAVAVIGLIALCISRFGPAARAYRYAYEAEGARTNLEWQQAEEFNQRAIELDPRFPEPHARLGDVYRAQAEWRPGPERAQERNRLNEQALAAYLRAMELNPFDTLTLIRLGRTYEHLARHDEALQTYQKGLVLDPNSALLHQHLGLLYRKLGNEPKAKEHFTLARDLSGWRDATAQINLAEPPPKK
jgi:O-antigen ligase